MWWRDVVVQAVNDLGLISTYEAMPAASNYTCLTKEIHAKVRHVPYVTLEITP